MHAFDDQPRSSDLIRLDPDHPGFRDPVYRARRNRIAAIALAYVPGAPVPCVEYTAAEEGVWRTIWERLGPLHREHVARELLELMRRLALERGPIPQLADLDRLLAAVGGARMEPVAGLVSARLFLSHLARRVLLSTQYMRHPSRPYYTPEPDLVHELVGHAATLAHPGIVHANELLGRAALIADEADMLRLERLYWYTFEFGVVEEGGRPKAFGAGLLSSAGELEQLEHGPELVPLDLERVVETPCDPTSMQPLLFVAPGFDALIEAVRIWVCERVLDPAVRRGATQREAGLRGPG